MNHSVGRKLKLTIPRDSGRLGGANDCEEDDDLGEREELHGISRERSCSGSEPELWQGYEGVVGGRGKGMLSSD